MDGTREGAGTREDTEGARCTACGSDGRDVAPDTTCCDGEGTRPAHRPRVAPGLLLAMVAMAASGPPTDAQGRVLLS